MSFDNYSDWDTPPKFDGDMAFWRVVGAIICFVSAAALAVYIFL